MTPIDPRFVRDVAALQRDQQILFFIHSGFANYAVVHTLDDKFALLAQNTSGADGSVHILRTSDHIDSCNDHALRRAYLDVNQHLDHAE